MELKYEWDKINEFNVEKPLCEIYTIFFFGDKLRRRRSKYKHEEISLPIYILTIKFIFILLLFLLNLHSLYNFLEFNFDLKF